MIRLFDILISVVALIILLPVFLVVAIFIAVDSKGGVFFLQTRVGKNCKDFKVWKFRTMYRDSDKKGLITVGERDSRITKVGYVLRRYKLDEFPQLINVLKGQMSMVGPRPEVRKYVDLYTLEQLKVLLVKPGITDNASITYSNENEVLAASLDPDKTYTEEILPHKIMLNMQFISNPTLGNYFRILGKTIRGLLTNS